MSNAMAEISNYDTHSLRQYTIKTVKALLAVHEGSFAVKNTERLNNAYRKRLAKKREVVRASGPRWRAPKAFTALPKSSQHRAHKRKSVFDAFYIAVEEMTLSASLAELVARQMALSLFGKAPCGRSIRRYVMRIEDCGGPEVAPIEAYADYRSCPHFKARKSKS